MIHVKEQELVAIGSLYTIPSAFSHARSLLWRTSQMKWTSHIYTLTHMHLQHATCITTQNFYDRGADICKAVHEHHMYEFNPRCAAHSLMKYGLHSIRFHALASRSAHMQAHMLRSCQGSESQQCKAIKAMQPSAANRAKPYITPPSRSKQSLALTSKWKG